MILEEGLPARFARHRLNAAAFREGVKAMGLQTLAHPDVVSPTVTCVKMPEGIASVEFLKHFREDHGLVTLQGLGDFRMHAVRIGHMGVTATPRNVLHALHAFDLILRRLGHHHACITSIYGMNFDYMPELHTRWGYPVLLAIMGLISLGMIIYLRRKNWL
jgi:aspartate aminotransferase-like enzyme